MLEVGAVIETLGRFEYGVRYRLFHRFEWLWRRIGWTWYGPVVIRGPRG